MVTYRRVESERRRRTSKRNLLNKISQFYIRQLSAYHLSKCLGAVPSLYKAHTFFRIMRHFFGTMEKKNTKKNKKKLMMCSMQSTNDVHHHNAYWQNKAQTDVRGGEGSVRPHGVKASKIFGRGLIP